MTRAYNFHPGPCGLPDEVMRTAQAEFCEYGDSGASIMELSHRGDVFLRVYREAEALLRQLMGIPEDYWVLFLQGGATGQDAAIPLNLLGKRRSAAYAITGHWSKRTFDESKNYCSAHIAADTALSNYTTLPTEWNVPAESAYLHYAANETIHGVEFPIPPLVPVPLVADMSSNILSREIRVTDYALIYAGAQKNMGPTGVTIVIVRRDCIFPQARTPAIWDYQKQHANESMYNTPPTFQIYMVSLVLKWLQAQGGVATIERRNQEKATLLYDYLDASNFYRTPVVGDCRSRMNVPFFLPDETLTTAFLEGAEERHLIGLKGHRVLGGCRASIYNAMPVAGVSALVNYMREFEKQRG